MGRAQVKPTFGSLFAGVGGFDMGMEQAGWECKFQVEWDKHCRSVLDLHWSDVEKWSDVRNVNGRFIPPVDCIIFGSPCQDLSKAGNRAGLSGDRSSLFFKQGRWSLNGNCWTANILESPKSVEGYSLSLDSFLIPEAQIPAKYFLSWKAVKGIFKRETQLPSTDHTEGLTNLELGLLPLSKQSQLSVLLAKHFDLEN
jgi:hypothetical protein